MESSMTAKGGLRTRGVIKTSRADKPLITIITATFNAYEYLPRTIKSIRNLTYDNIEWIIVDGGSKDGTVELILQNEDLIDYWISEADRGIPDAWNKGVLLARGDWVAFLGSGDSYHPYAIGTYINAISVSPTMPDLASSRVRFVNRDGSTLRVIGAPFRWAAFKRRMGIAHVGALHRRSLFAEYGLFDTSYSSAADYEFLMRCGENLNAIYLDDITADALIGGISNSYKSMYEGYLIQKRYGGGISAKFAFWFACVKRFIRPLLRGY